MIAFWVLAAFLIASAVWTIAASKPVYSVVALLLNFAALAVVYVTLSAEFLAVIQIIVYSGAILVLFVFVIALLSSGVAPFAAGPNRLPRIWLPAGIVVAVAFGFLTYALSSALMPPAPPT
ncbi:MAG: NADH-quinone oxidoreductase subunit J, partial [Candidatus Baltobacteraceae bacterium]